MQTCKKCHRPFNDLALICSSDGELLKDVCILDRYFLEEKIGLGGMGFVYKAKHRSLGKGAAIEILKPEADDDYDLSKDRFRREAQIMADLEHQNIIKISDFDNDSEYAYFVMELLSGKSLEEKLREATTLSPEESSYILSEVCDAVAYAHENGVLHRDLKPSNIFLVSTKDGEKIKVLDFGIAKILDPAAARLTQTGMTAGTPSYMSPEQWRGEKDIDHRADIYSLGVILYEMLCGKLPFESSETGCEISPQIARVIYKALAAERNQRQESAVQLAEEFENAVRREISGMNETKKMKNEPAPNEDDSLDDERRTHQTFRIKNNFEGKVSIKGDFNA